MKKALFCIPAILLLTGCATFHNQPIKASDTALRFERRSLNNLEIKEFLEKNLHRRISPWPPAYWDFETLTLAAFYYHPDLDVARAKWGIAQAGIITAGARPNPVLGIDPTYNINALSGVSPWIFDSVLNIPIETAGKRGYRISQAKHLSETARLNISFVAWQVRSRLRVRLLNFYAANRAQDILKRQLAIQEENVKVLKERLIQGEVSFPVFNQAQLSLNKTELSLHEAQKQNAQACVELADALGLPVGAIEGVEFDLDIFNRISLLDNFSLADARQCVLLNRPDILGILGEYAASQSALQLEIAKQYPDIKLGPGYTWDQGATEWALGLTVTLPVLNQNQGPIAEAEARRKETMARFVALQAKVIAEIGRAMEGYRAAHEKFRAAETLFLTQKRQKQFIDVTNQEGDVRRVSLLNAQIELDSAELSYLDALVEVQQALGQLEDAFMRPLDSLDYVSLLSKDPPRHDEGYRQ